MGAHGAALFGDAPRLVTQCNAGGLATGGYGTALGVVRALASAARGRTCWVAETRPLLQGCAADGLRAREARHPAHADRRHAVAHVIGRGEVDGVVVGADRIAANGDTANKIGTYALAVAARPPRGPVLRRRAHVDDRRRDADGAAIPIEERGRGRRVADALRRCATRPSTSRRRG